MNLTQTAIFTKRLMAILAALLILSLSGWMGYRYYYYNIYLPSQPTKVELPNVKFGLLPKPVLKVATTSSTVTPDKTLISATNYSYSIDTATGSLPDKLPTFIKVYFIPHLSTTLLSTDQAKNLATSFGFKSDPVIKNPLVYQFTDNQDGQFVTELEFGNFKYYKQIATNSAALQDPIFAHPSKLVTDFKEFLESKGLLNNNLRDGRTNVLFDKLEQQTSATATISLWPNNVDDIPIITPEFITGTINGVVNKFQDQTLKYPSLDYFYWEIDKNNFGTYPLKKIDQAFEEVKNGQGSIVIDPKTSKVSITSAYLAYLLYDYYTPYLQPVYVFEGLDFAALVSAIPTDYLIPDSK